MTAPSGVTALVLGAVSIAVSVVAAKQALVDGVSTDTVLAARLLLAAPVLLLIAAPMIRAAGPRPSAGPIAIGLGAGVTLWLGGRAEFEGLARLPAGMLVVVLATAPVWVAFIGWLVWRRRITRMDVFALVALVGGVTIMAAPVGASVDALGLLFGVSSAISFALFLTILERNESVSAMLGLVLGMIGAAIAFVLADPGTVGGLVENLDNGLLLTIGAAGVLWTLFVGRGLGATNSVTAAIVVASEPLFAASLAFFLLSESLAARELLGGAVVLLALAAVAIQAGRARERSVPVG